MKTIAWMVLFLLTLSACAPVSPQLAEPTQAQTLKTLPAILTPHPLPSATTASSQKPAAPAPTSTPLPGAAASTPNPPSAPIDTSGFHGPLSVIIHSPAQDAVVQTADLTLTGEADPETVLSIDDQYLLVGAQREFSVPLHLDEGPNIIEITASDPSGNQDTLYLTISYDPQP